MRKIFFVIFLIYSGLKSVVTTFVFDSKEVTILPKELINTWLDENEYVGIYGKSDIFTIIILPDCEDTELLETTIRSILMTANRNLLHEIIILNNCSTIKNYFEFKIQDSKLNSELIKMIETELQELGDLQNLGVSSSSGDIILFVFTATLFPKNWMSNIMRTLSDNNKSIAVPMLKKLNKNNWKFSTQDLVYPPKMMFSKNNFQLLNFHTNKKEMIFFFSSIFAIKRIWWDVLLKFSDPMINLIFKSNINLDLSLRSWNCGGTVVEIKDLAFGISKIRNFQPNFEMRQILLESWIDKEIIAKILKNSDTLTQFINNSSEYMLKSLILKRNEIIENSKCNFKSFLGLVFKDELHHIGLIDHPKTHIEYNNTNFCFTPIPIENNSEFFKLELSICESKNSSQLFFIDKESKFLFFACLQLDNFFFFF